ncbi:hypothetical protein [Vibrio sp. 10N.261.46.A3]|uniref:hypothetical protein n=1 Tax=Vibrio sp. 10N.261.46.A3 TaxID=3229658 RepID=UPI0035519AAC
MYENEVIREEAEAVVNALLPEIELTQGVNLYLSVMLGSKAASVLGVSDSYFRSLVRGGLASCGWNRFEFRAFLHKRLCQALIESGVTPSGQGFSASPRVDNPNDD